MARFYVLPARGHLGFRFAELLHVLFPGLTFGRSEWSDLAEVLGAAAGARADTYVVFAEDLADDVPLDRVLQRDFGAEPGDEIIEVSLPGPLAEAASRHHRLGLRLVG